MIWEISARKISPFSQRNQIVAVYSCLMRPYLVLPEGAVTSAPKTNTVPAAEKLLVILEAIASSKFGLALPQIVKKTAIAKSSAHCLLVTLERKGYIHRSVKTGRYMFGAKLFCLANMSVMGLSIREEAAPMLRALAVSSGLTVYMAILDNGEAMLISKMEPCGSPRLASWVGKRMELHCTGLGKALIAHLPEPELLDFIKTHGLARHNEKTISSCEELLLDLATCARRGYALDDEEHEIGFRCAAVPVNRADGEVVAAISVAGTTSQIKPATLLRLVRSLKETASAISKCIPG